MGTIAKSAPLTQGKKLPKVVVRVVLIHLQRTKTFDTGRVDKIPSASLRGKGNHSTISSGVHTRTMCQTDAMGTQRRTREQGIDKTTLAHSGVPTEEHNTPGNVRPDLL